LSLLIHAHPRDGGIVSSDNGNGDRADADYQVEDKRPPKHTQFKRGVSGNPKGRPKGSLNMPARVAKQMRQKVTVTRNGRPVSMGKGDLIALRIVDAAAKGELKAAMFAVRLDDETAVALSETPNEEAFELPNKANLRFIADRLAALIGDAE
jgi:hypothetical protein